MQQKSVHLETIVEGMKSIQTAISTALEDLDGRGRFNSDHWVRPSGGGGCSKIMLEGDLIAKGGVNFSHVHGPMPERIANGLGLTPGVEFHATGVSIVLHAKNPFVPIIHMNVRYFQTSGGKHWFGGGIDATPIYIQKGEAVSFHQLLKSVCDRFPSHSYLKYKTWADRYFYLKHREETRGIGGIFFDHLAADDEPTKQMNWEFVQEVAAAFVQAYESLAQPNRLKAYGERELEWQALRRSRYVEFNLLWDKGTRFGLDSDGRTESILMSMPPEAKWVYNHNPLPDSPEADTLLHLKPTDWLGLETKHGLEKAYPTRN